MARGAPQALQRPPEEEDIVVFWRAALCRRRGCKNGCEGGLEINRNKPEPKRQHPAHTPIVEFGNRQVVVFLTVCTKDRKPILACEDVHHLLIQSWSEADYWKVGRYVIMPDHIHLFCCPACFSVEGIRKWIKYWKSIASQSWPRKEEQPVWMQDGWDTQLRRGDSYAEKWNYVRNNPVRAGLVQNADDWPYQGELNVLMWHDA